MIGNHGRTEALLLVGVALATLAGCGGRANPNVKEAVFTPQASSNAAPITVEPTPGAYRIGPLDELKVTVFQEEDLSVEDLPVDVNGTISLPLVGQIQAAGRTAKELAGAIAANLNKRYLRDAQVAVSVTKPTNYSVTIDGEVKKPGVYQIPGSLTLLQAISLGEGTSEFARQNDVYVFRTINGERSVARFDLRAIRSAMAPDPKIQQADVIVVGYSRLSRLTRDVITALPGLAGVFIAIRR